MKESSSSRTLSSLVLILSLQFVYWDVGRTLEEFVNHSPAARDLQICLVFDQHPACFINLKPIETCGLLLKYIFQQTLDRSVYYQFFFLLLS